MACPFMAWRLAEAHTWTAKKKRISKINRTSDQARWGQEPHSFSHTRFVVSEYARFQCFDESWRVSLVVLWRREKKWTRLLYLTKISHTWFIKNQREYHLIQFLILASFGKPKQREMRDAVVVGACLKRLRWCENVKHHRHRGCSLGERKSSSFFADSEKCGEAKWLKNDLRMREKIKKNLVWVISGVRRFRSASVQTH